MSPATDTSRVAYREHAIAGKATTQRERILAFVRWAGRTIPVSRATIAHGFSPTYWGWMKRTDRLSLPAEPGGTWDGGPPIPLASVCGRVNALIADGSLRVLSEPARDPSTGHLVELIEAVYPEPKQRTFEDFMPSKRG